jgi:alkylhydroperoxidase family enzyme
VAPAPQDTGPLDTMVVPGLPQVVHRSLVETLDAIWEQAPDPRLLELIRLRMAQLLRGVSELERRTPAAVGAGLDEAVIAELSRWPTSDRFDERDRIVLGWVEQWLVDVQGISDDDAARVRAIFDPTELAHLTLAVALFEALIRAQVALDTT